MSRPIHETVFDGHWVAPGQMLGRYELLLPIAAGGMGNVWVARLKGTRGFRKLVALKTIRRTYEEAWMEQMFFQEATLASQIHHPNVVETLELGEQDGIMYLVMELVHGESLSYLIREAFARDGIPLPLAVNLIGQACKGLQAAHDLCDEEGRRIGLVHRDISPPNILVTYSGTVKIADFGVATTKSSATCPFGEIKGKISYLAPEQARAQEDVDARADIFTTAVVLYLLTVGRHPFKAKTETETIGRILDETPVTPPSYHLPNYPRVLEAVLVRGLAKDREARWPTAAAFFDALSHAMPEAFGPNSEKEVADFVQEVLKDRMVERRTRLRLAEELAEKSGPHDSVTAVSAVLPSVSVPVPQAPKSPRRMWAGASLVLAGALLGLGFHYLSPLRAHAGSALPSHESALSEAAAGAGRVNAAARPEASAQGAPWSPGGIHGVEPSPIPHDRQYLSFPQPPLEAPPAVESTGHGRQSRLSRSVGGTTASPVNGAAESQQPELDGSPSASGASASPSARARDSASAPPNEQPQPIPGNPELSSVLAALVASSDPSAGAPTSTVSLPGTATAGGSPTNGPNKSSGVHDTPRLLSARTAHALLNINPSVDPYRVKLPAALEHMKESFSAAVQVCVSHDGSVSAVRVLRSAGPAIDPQIPGTLGRWRYRPYVENGKAVPFCYSFRYQVGGE